MFAASKALMPALPELQKYVPAWVTARLAGQVCPERFDASLMIADVSGFTALGRRLAVDPEGAEKLWRIVNGFFGRALDLIQEHGGDVLRFAGDAPIVLWSAHETGLDEAIRRATACALALQERLGEYDTGEGVVVRFRVGLGAGEVFAVELGEVWDRWEPVVGGAPFAQVARALGMAKIGQVVAPRGLLGSLQGVTSQPLESGLVQITGLPAGPVAPLAVAQLEGQALDNVRRFVSRGVVERVQAGHAGWLGELRAVSTLFVSVRGLSDDDPELTTRLRALLPALQEAVYGHGGSVNQFLVDDKGTVLLAAWGLPGTTHVDDPARAVHAAYAVLEALESEGLTGTAGVSTGRVFCGVKGNGRRSEYGLLGASVNLAARLMECATEGILCDRETERASRGAFAFEALTSLALKGHDEPVPVYRPASEEVVVPTTRALIGRETEIGVLLDHLDALRKPGVGGVVLLEGEAGIGKSVILAELPLLVRQRDLAVLTGAGDAIESRTPYFALRAVFSELLGLEGIVAVEEREAAVLRWFEAHPERIQRAPLLNPVLGVALPETQVTQPMEGEARVEQTRALALALLGTVQPLVLVIDDLQWVDSASWDLLRFAMRELPSTLFAFATRPADAEDTVREQLLRAPDLAHLPLGPLPSDDLFRMLVQRLGVTELPEPVVRMVEERAEGNPFYAEELVLALMDEGVLRIDAKGCRLEPGADLAVSSLPRTLDGLIGARLDLLSPVELLSLKTASVIGRTFAQDMLCGLYPMDSQRAFVPDALDSVRKRDLTQVERPEPDLMYLFKHVITQEVAYSQLLFEQRRTLHAAAARWYEEGKAGPTTPFLALIAHHWRRAEVRDRAIDALEKAGEQAFASFAHRETIEFLQAAEELDASGGTPSSEARRGRWARLIGESCSHLGRTDDGLANLNRAVALLGAPLPSGTLAVVFALLSAAFVQIRRRWLGAPTPLNGDSTVPLAAVNTLAELSLLAYYQANVPLTLLASLRALNLAEDWGPSPELARLKAAFAHIANGAQLHGAAERYSVEAVEIAAQFEDGVSTARSHQYRGALLCAYGRWDEVQAHADVAMEASRTIGHGRGQEESLNLEGYTAIWLGDYPRALRAADEMGRSARWRDDPQVEFWAQVQRAEALWQSGDAEAARLLLEDVDLASQTDATMRHRGYGVLAHALIDLDRLDDARAVVEGGLLPQKRPTSFIEGRGYTAPAQVFLDLWARDGAVFRKAAVAACKTLATFASIFPQGRAISAYYHGRQALLDGRIARGRAQLEVALELAKGGGHHHDRTIVEHALASLGT